MDDRRGGSGASGHVSGLTKSIPCKFPIAGNGLSITEVRISTRSEDKLKAFVSITLNDAIAIRGIKVIEGRERLFVAMPSRPKPDGSFQDVVHPINQDTRQSLEGHVLRVYYDVIEEKPIQ